MHRAALLNAVVLLIEGSPARSPIMLFGFLLLSLSSASPLAFYLSSTSRFAAQHASSTKDMQTRIQGEHVLPGHPALQAGLRERRRLPAYAAAGVTPTDSAGSRTPARTTPAATFHGSGVHWNSSEARRVQR